MDRKAANEQRQEALWCVFLMFVVMALIVVRTGVVSRSLSGTVAPDEELEAAAAGLDHRRPRTPDELGRAVLAMLSLAEAAGRLYDSEVYADWEVMNRPPAHPARALRRNVAGLSTPPAPRLDTS